MPWSFQPALIQSVASATDLVTKLTTELSRLSQVVKCYEKVPALFYGPVVQVPGDTSRTVYLAVTNGSAFTMANPDRPREGVQLTIHIYNNSGGAMGAVTWGSEYRFTGGFTAPANGGHALLTFYRSL